MANPVITDILLREDVFPGAAMNSAPDLTLVLRDHSFVSVRNRGPVVVTRDVVSGTHHPDGIFIASGPGIAANHDRPLLSIVDVPSTLLYSLGLPVPADFEGRVPAPAFTDELVESRPVTIGPATQLCSSTARLRPPSHRTRNGRPPSHRTRNGSKS